MANTTTTRICLSCKYFRPTDEREGKCRLQKGVIEPSAYPSMGHGDTCESWQNAGQQFHIRVGWIKGLQKKTQAGGGGVEK